MNRLWAIDRSYSEQLRSIQEMPLSVQDRKDLQTAFDELEDPYYEEDGTAYLKIQGVLTKRWNLMTWLMGGYPTPYLQHMFQQAASSSEVDQIVLLFDSPGGEVAGLSEFAQVIRECEKPVHAHISGHCTSGAYWLASQADRITGSRTSLIGSIGALLSFIRLKDSCYEEVIFRSSKHKAPDPESKEGKEDYQSLVDGIAEIFEADIATGRGVAVEVVQDFYGQGKVFLGDEALTLGMIDEIINKAEFVSYLASEPEIIGGSMNEKKQKQVEAVEPSQAPAETVDTGHAAAEAERDRIKGIMTLGGSEELTAQAIDEGMTVEAAAVKVNAELKAKLKELKDNRAEDAKVLENVPQDPAADVVPAGGNVNALGIDRSQIDAELDKYTMKEV